MTTKNDIFIYESEDYDILFDVLRIIAYSENNNPTEYNRIKSTLLNDGYQWVNYGKNRVLEKSNRDCKISLSYNNRLKRWAFTFDFKNRNPPEFFEPYIHEYIQNYLHQNLPDYDIQPDGSSEFTVDLKLFGTQYISKLFEAIDKVRDKERLYFHTWIDNTFVKCYLKGKRIRIETDVKKTGVKNLTEIIEKIFRVRKKLTITETRHEIYFQCFQKSLDELKTITMNNSERIEGIITELSIIETTDNTNYNSENFTQILRSIGEAQNNISGTIAALGNNQTMLIENIRLLNLKLNDDLEAIFNQNNSLQNSIESNFNQLNETISQNNHNEIIYHDPQIAGAHHDVENENYDYENMFRNAFPRTPIERVRIIIAMLWAGVRTTDLADALSIKEPSAHRILKKCIAKFPDLVIKFSGDFHGIKYKFKT